MDWSHLIVGLAAVAVSGILFGKLRRSTKRRSFRFHIDYDSTDNRELGDKQGECYCGPDRSLREERTMSDEITPAEEEVLEDEDSVAAAGPLGVTPQDDGSQLVGTVDGTEVLRVPAITDVENPARSMYETDDELEEDLTDEEIRELEQG